MDWSPQNSPQKHGGPPLQPQPIILNQIDVYNVPVKRGVKRTLANPSNQEYKRVRQNPAALRADGGHKGASATLAAASEGCGGVTASAFTQHQLQHHHAAGRLRDFANLAR